MTDAYVRAVLSSLYCQHCPPSAAHEAKRIDAAEDREEDKVGLTSDTFFLLESKGRGRSGALVLDVVTVSAIGVLEVAVWHRLSLNGGSVGGGLHVVYSSYSDRQLNG